MASKIHRNIITATLPDERHFTDPTSILIGTTVARRGPRTYSGGVFTFELTMELAASSAERAMVHFNAGSEEMLSTPP